MYKNEKEKEAKKNSQSLNNMIHSILRFTVCSSFLHRGMILFFSTMVNNWIEKIKSMESIINPATVLTFKEIVLRHEKLSAQCIESYFIIKLQHD